MQAFFFSKENINCIDFRPPNKKRMAAVTASAVRGKRPFYLLFLLVVCLLHRRIEIKELPTNHHCVTVLTANSAEINSLLMGPTSRMNESTAKRYTVHFSESAHKLPPPFHQLTRKVKQKKCKQNGMEQLASGSGPWNIKRKRPAVNCSHIKKSANQQGLCLPLVHNYPEYIISTPGLLFTRQLFQNPFATSADETRRETDFCCSPHTSLFFFTLCT